MEIEQIPKPRPTGIDQVDAINGLAAQHEVPPPAKVKAPAVERTYIVLEEKAGVFTPVAELTTTNAENAYREVVRDRFGDTEGSLKLIAVSKKKWKPVVRGQAPGGMKYVGG